MSDSADWTSLRGIAFDLDGTLWPRQAGFQGFVAEEQRKAPGHRLDPEELARLDRGGYGPKEPLLAYLAQCFDWPERDFASRHARFAAGVVAAVPPDPALVRIVERLTGRYRVGLISNGQGGMQRRKIEKLGLTRHLDPILISAEVAASKPSPKIFEHLLRAWRCEPSEILVVGDSPVHDVAGAQALGMRAVWVSDGQAWPLATPAPLTVRSVQELAPLLG